MVCVFFRGVPWATYLHGLNPDLVRFTETLAIRWYGLAYLMGFFVGWKLLVWFSRRGQFALKEEKILDFITLAAIFGVMLGGRLGHFLFYNPQLLFSDPLVFFRVWEGGMASHGGIIGLILFTYYYSRKHDIGWTHLGDHLVIAAAPGLFFGRMANFINGELYGKTSEVPWAVRFPMELYDRAVETPGIAPVYASLDPLPTRSHDIYLAAQSNPDLMQEMLSLIQPRHPSQIYEALLEGLFLFVVLLGLRLGFKRLPDGFLTGIFFLVYALMRILCEMFKNQDYTLILGMPRGAFYSYFMILIGVSFLLYAVIRRKYFMDHGLKRS